MAAAVERIVVQATAQEKKAIAAKARRLGLPISELMRRGATAYRADADEELGALADAAKAAADRAAAAIESAVTFIEASNKRIAALEARPEVGGPMWPLGTPPLASARRGYSGNRLHARAPARGVRHGVRYLEEHLGSELGRGLARAAARNPTPPARVHIAYGISPIAGSGCGGDKR
jgi:hypothetical protein